MVEGRTLKAYLLGFCFHGPLPRLFSLVTTGHFGEFEVRIFRDTTADKWEGMWLLFCLIIVSVWKGNVCFPRF